MRTEKRMRGRTANALPSINKHEKYYVNDIID